MKNKKISKNLLTVYYIEIILINKTRKGGKIVINTYKVYE